MTGNKLLLAAAVLLAAQLAAPASQAGGKSLRLQGFFASHSLQQGHAPQAANKTGSKTTSSSKKSVNRPIKAQSDLKDKDKKTKDAITRNIRG